MNDNAARRAPLTGRRIAVFEHRELGRLAGMLEAQGAQVLRCPLVAIADAPDEEAVAAWLRRAIDAPFDDLILTTGEGLRRLVGFAERAGLDAAFRAALGKMRTVTRGPKPVQALREIGLGPGLRAAAPTSDGIVAALSIGDLRGRRIGVQLYPEAAIRLVDFLTGAGASPDPVLPYAYVPAGDPAGTLALFEEIGAGRVDIVAFTSAAQVSRLFDEARTVGKEPELCAALRRTAVAAVGPVVAGELQRRGIPVAAMPRDAFFMKPLVSAIAAFLSP